MDNDQNGHPQPPMKVRFNTHRNVPPQPLMLAGGHELEEQLKSMRHDLRSSIGIIQNTLYLLQEETGEATERTRRFIRVLQRQATHMEQILDRNRRQTKARLGTL